MQTSRRHDIDALRAIAFGLLILYHTGMFYVSWDWHVKSAYVAHWLEPLMMVVNQWRMPLIFLISGLALNFLWGSASIRGSSRALARARIRRLLPPLIFGMLVIVPPQAYFQALANGATQPGYLDFLVRYFTFAPWPEDAFDGSDIGITWNHLWYLPYVLVYSLAAIGLLQALEHGRLVGLRQWWHSRRSLSVYLVPVAVLMPMGLWLFPVFPFISHDLVWDWYAHAMYGTFFILGLLTGRNAGLWREFARLRWWSLGLGVLTFATLRALALVAPQDSTFAFDVAQSFIVYLNRWTWILAVLGMGHQYLNRPMGWLEYANRAVFPWYVFHQTLTVTGGALLTPYALGPVLEPVLVLGITIGGCALFMFLVERFVPWLGLWVGLGPAARRRRLAAGLGAS